MSLSAIILTKNEENTIIDCIESLSFCDEVIVVDDNSSDRTIEIIKSLKRPNLHIYTNTLTNFSSQRNFGLSKAVGDWVFFVDADERVPKKLASEIEKNISTSPNVNGYFIKRVDVIWGKELKYGETGDIFLLRIAKKGSGAWKGIVHEIWEVKGSTKKLESHLEHYPHKNVYEFLYKVNTYTSLRAEELYMQGVKSSWVSILLYPKAKFIVNYLIKRGYKDGVEGLIDALMMSFHSFLVRGKLYLLWRDKKK